MLRLGFLVCGVGLLGLWYIRVLLPWLDCGCLVCSLWCVVMDCAVLMLGLFVFCGGVCVWLLRCAVALSGSVVLAVSCWFGIFLLYLLFVVALLVVLALGWGGWVWLRVLVFVGVACETL